MTYGLYVFRSSTPVYTGTQSDCYRETRNLSDTDWLQGWTIKPYEPKPAPRQVPRRIHQVLWAAVGTGIIFFVVVTTYLALKGHLQ